MRRRLHIERLKTRRFFEQQQTMVRSMLTRIQAEEQGIMQRLHNAIMKMEKEMVFVERCQLKELGRELNREQRIKQQALQNL